MSCLVVSTVDGSIMWCKGDAGGDYENSPEHAVGDLDVAPVVEDVPAACVVAYPPGACYYFSWRRTVPHSYSCS